MPTGIEEFAAVFAVSLLKEAVVHSGKKIYSAVQSEGFQNLKDHYAKLGKAAANGDVLLPAMHGAAERIVARAKAKCPVDTGRLRDSIRIFPKSVPGGRGVSIGTSEGHLGSDVHYAFFVEYGTSKMAAHPFLRPALDEEQFEWISQQVKQGLEDLWDVSKSAAIGMAIDQAVGYLFGTSVAVDVMPMSAAPATIKFAGAKKASTVKYRKVAPATVKYRRAA